MKFYSYTSPRDHIDNQNRPSQPFVDTSSFREYILALERDDNPSSKNRDGQSQCNILGKASERSAALRVNLNHVHTEDGLLKNGINKLSWWSNQ